MQGHSLLWLPWMWLQFKMHLRSFLTFKESTSVMFHTRATKARLIILATLNSKWTHSWAQPHCGSICQTNTSQVTQGPSKYLTRQLLTLLQSTGWQKSKRHLKPCLTCSLSASLLTADQLPLCKIPLPSRSPTTQQSLWTLRSQLWWVPTRRRQWLSKVRVKQSTHLPTRYRSHRTC